MAATTKSLAGAAAVFIVGLLFGTLAMTGVLFGLDLGPDSTAGYTSRPELAVLPESPRVRASVADAGSLIKTRSSDTLTAQTYATPIRLVIPAINVDASVSQVGLEPTAGDESTVEVPGLGQAGWYKFGSAPGQPGATVMAGHVDLNGLQGVFWSLDALAGGEIIEVHMSDDSVALYRVMRGTTFSRDALPSDELFREAGAPALHLITCGGAFNRNLQSYESNLVVTAAPIYGEA